MKRRAILAVVAGAGVVNGLNLDHLPPWRQLLFIVLAVAAYLHGRHLPGRGDWLLLSLAAVAAAGFVVPDFWEGGGALMVYALFVVSPWLAGRFRGQQADLILVGRHRVTQLEREQELVAERARLRERARIAADMHDSLGHELALIALRAGALELATDMTEPNREAAAQLRASAVTATDRLRRTVGVLREADAVLTDVYRTSDETVEALVQRACDAGMAVEFRREGEGRVLPPLVDRAAHRVVQESLTNAARHAPGADVLVHVADTSEAVVVTVSNSAPREQPGPSDGGSGLAGLRERVRLLGGSLSAGPRGDGFAVTVRLPCDRDDNRVEESEALR
ncbi:two-component sensor histidine kinase [Micromonospora sp. KC606]|uniref:sensor histidine kinase n=1 Tax=Micromonospora sp. KC606 TaxID=2530379 RepID=UPI00104AB84E|nr:histidine kinase [Micromonospora sp. KC606]TDC82648.1 two-component sensor histidine kinase [Micromonospora sp. KC606]